MNRLLKLIFFTSLLTFTLTVQAEQALIDNSLQLAAEQGDAKAEAKLGAMYLLGRGVDKDEIKAAEWLLKSANQGNVDAEVLMAALYDRGLGVPHNIETATHWYEKAAADGSGPALAILGKNTTGNGKMAFNYKIMRLNAAKQIPTEYANKILFAK